MKQVGHWSVAFCNFHLFKGSESLECAASWYVMVTIVTDNPLRTCWKSIMIVLSRKSLKPLKFSRQILVSQEIYRCMTSLKPLCGWSHGLKSQPKVKGQMWQMIEYMNTLGRIRDTWVFLYVSLLFCQGNVKVFFNFFSSHHSWQICLKKRNIVIVYFNNL